MLNTATLLSASPQAGLATTLAHLHQQAAVVPMPTWRQLAWQQARVVGLPSADYEAWKYEDRKRWLAPAWQLWHNTLAPKQVDALGDWLASDRISQDSPADTALLVIANGQPVPQLSDPAVLACLHPATDATLTPWVQAVSDDNPASLLADAMALAPLASCPQPWELKLEASLNRPVRVVFAVCAASAEQPLPSAAWCVPVLAVTLAPHVQANVAVDVVSLPPVQAPTSVEAGEVQPLLVSPLVLVNQAEASELSRLKLPRTHDANLHVAARLAENAQYHALSLAVFDEIAQYRHVEQLVKQGEGSHAHSTGLTLLHHKQRVHHHMAVAHHAPNTTTEQHFKALVANEAISEFDGTLIVKTGADGTDAKQLSNNILLSQKAKAFARPWLQIDADDVKCAHGATVGQLNADEVFYLRSRGLRPDQARQALFGGYALAAITPEHPVVAVWQRLIETQTRLTLERMICPGTTC